MPSLDVAAGGPAGHEHPLAAFGGHTTQGQVFEGIDGHGRDVVPVPHAAQGFATLLAIALKRHIVLKLVCKHPQRQRIEALFRKNLSVACLHKCSESVAGRGAWQLFLRRHDPIQVHGFGVTISAGHVSTWHAPRSRFILIQSA